MRIPRHCFAWAKGNDGRDATTPGREMNRSSAPVSAGYFVAPFALVVALLLAIPNAHAGKYELVQGQGVEVCEAYGKSLNSFRQLPYPMACERKLDPKLSQFAKPKWEEMDVWSNRQLLRDVEYFFRLEWRIDYETWQRILAQRIHDRHRRLLLADVDINNDEKKDNVLKYINGSCTGTHFYATPLLAIKANDSTLDIEKTHHLLQNPGSTEAGRWGYTMYDVFIYKNQTYFDRWSELADQKGVLKVFQTRDNQTQELCSYRYEANE